MIMSAQQYPQMPPMPDFLSKEEVALLKRTLLAKFPEDEQEMFVRICQRTFLDPFTKQIYPTKRYNKVRDEQGGFKKVPTLVAVTGIMGLTAIAERTHHYKGSEISWCGEDGEWKEAWLADGYPRIAKCVVYHDNHKIGDRYIPEVGIAQWNSYVGTAWNNDTKKWEVSDFWAKMPDFMLGKCAKAQALRGAFPDQTANVYIREELESEISEAETETATIPDDEQKILDNRRREAEIKASGQFQVVDQEQTSQASPSEMTEPALERDKIPPKPREVPPPSKPQEQDQTPPQSQPGAQAPELSSPMTDVESGPDWREHVIVGVAHVKFHKRRIGELNQAELAIIEQQWLPAIREQWDDATDAQRTDARMFESAIAFHKMAKII